MKTFWLTLPLSLFLSCSVYAVEHAEVEVFFSPYGGARDKIISEIDNAQKEVKMLAYIMTDKEIADALIRAKRRGLDVIAIIDPHLNNDKNNQDKRLNESGVPTYIDYRHNLAHNKVIVIDDDKVLTGSYNYYVDSDTVNAENMAVLKSESVNKKYKDNFKVHLDHSVKYGEKPTESYQLFEGQYVGH
ncbi:MAG: phospholipase D-like domain-containing protein [Burkholderiales bacterium]|nr:phospholipase D-like domain-containing protein [Burkholderiales bacterium]